MKAFILDRYGSADGVRAGEMPDSASPHFPLSTFDFQNVNLDPN